jgi:hypothetical protein
MAGVSRFECSFARSRSGACAVRSRSLAAEALLSVVALILRATRVNVSCKNSEFVIEVNSYLNIPPRPGRASRGQATSYFGARL